MWSQIGIGYRAKKEVVLLLDKEKESKSLVEATIESVGVKARKIRDELEISFQLLADAREELLVQHALAKKHREEGKKTLEELCA